MDDRLGDEDDLLVSDPHFPQASHQFAGVANVALDHAVVRESGQGARGRLTSHLIVLHPHQQHRRVKPPAQFGQHESVATTQVDHRSGRGMRLKNRQEKLPEDGGNGTGEDLPGEEDVAFAVDVFFDTPAPPPQALGVAEKQSIGLQQGLQISEGIVKDRS